MDASQELAMSGPQNWTQWLLSPTESTSHKQNLLRLVCGLGLASAFGVSMGMVTGGLDLLHHAVGVPAAWLGVAALGLPALFIGLSLLGTQLEPGALLSATCRGVATGGVVLAGLAPMLALFAVTNDSALATRNLAGWGLAVATLLGARTVFASLQRASISEDSTGTHLSYLLYGVFAVFGSALTVRIWSSVLPLFGGAS